MIKSKFCENCGITIPIKINRDMLRKRFCSRGCQYKYNRRNGILINPWDYPEIVIKMKNNMKKTHTITSVLLLAARKRGLNRTGKRIKGKEISCEQCGKLFYVPTSRIDGRIDKSGQGQIRKYCSRKCWGLTLRKSDLLKTDKVLLKEWAVFVKERDDYTCRECGCIRKRLLQSHHIVSKESNPSLWYEISNGITLCVYCHAKQHSELLTNFILSSLHLRGVKKPYEQRIFGLC